MIKMKHELKNMQRQVALLLDGESWKEAGEVALEIANACAVRVQVQEKLEEERRIERVDMKR